MRKTLLVAYDFSACSDAALERAVEHLDGQPGRLVLFHVREEGGLLGDPAGALGEVAATTRAAHPDVEVDVRIVTGEVASAVVENASAVDATRIFMGTHGDRRVGRFFLTSTAAQVVRSTKIPVLAVPCEPAACARDASAPGVQPEELRIH